MKLILKIVLGIVIATILIIGGCAALVGGTLNEVDKELTESQNENAITEAEFKSLRIGTPLSEVKAEFGKPEDTQTMNIQGQKNVTIYYNVKGGELMDMYQLSFDAGKLTSKSKF